MLASRSVLFIFFQLLIALILTLAGTSNAWGESARYWTLLVFLANFVSLYLLVRVYKAEGKRFWKVLRFSHQTWKKDLLWFIGDPGLAADTEVREGIMGVVVDVHPRRRVGKM